MQGNSRLAGLQCVLVCVCLAALAFDGTHPLPIDFFAWPQGKRNLTLIFGDTHKQEIAEGVLRWPGLVASSDELSTKLSNFYVAPALLPAEKANAVVELLATEGAEDESDRLDSEVAFELYLESASGFLDIMKNPQVFEKRQAIRDRVRSILAPILESRIAPIVAQTLVAAGCGNTSETTACIPCASLIQRHLPRDRRTRRLRFDIPAFATVAINLNSHGQDYLGGLYVAASQERKLLPLQQGDAVVHTSDLLHGVHTTEGSLWSWIIWFGNSPTCEKNSHTWHEEHAKAGDPVAQFLHAMRLESSQKLQWLQKSAEAGFGPAMTHLGSAYFYGTEGVSKDETKAERLLHQAIASFEEAGAMHELAMIYKRRSSSDKESNWLEQAVGLWQRAADMGVAESMYELGKAHELGVGGLKPDLEAALAWHLSARNAKSSYEAFKLYSKLGKSDAARRELVRAANLGLKPAKKRLAQLPRAEL